MLGLQNGVGVLSAAAQKDGRASVHGGRIPYLDGWRGLAILTVLVSHFDLRADPRAAGVLGVQLFFVLSGRLMAEILFIETFPLKAFFWRRFTRIYPGLLAFVGVSFFVCQGTFLTFKPLAAAAALTFTLNYAIAFTHHVGVLDNVWSLCIEEHAYAFLGLVALLARRRGFNPALLIAGVAGLSMLDALVSRLVLHQSYFEVYWRTDAQVSAILCSTAAFLWIGRRRTPAWLPIVSLALALLFYLGPDEMQYTLTPMALAVSVASLDNAPQAVHRVLSWTPLRLMGLASYSIYLWQQPLFQYARHGLLQPAPCFVAAVAVGALSYKLIETPARRWLNRARRPRFSPPAAPKTASGGLQPAIGD